MDKGMDQLLGPLYRERSLLRLQILQELLKTVRFRQIARKYIKNFR